MGHDSVSAALPCTAVETTSARSVTTRRRLLDMIILIIIAVQYSTVQYCAMVGIERR
jgi:hypothetical protein